MSRQCSLLWPKLQQAQRLVEPTDATDTGMSSCPSCGKENRLGVKFCRYCGAAIESIPAAPQRSRARIVTVSFLVLVILMVCISLIGISWGLGVDLWLFPTATPTSGINFLLYLIS